MHCIEQEVAVGPKAGLTLVEVLMAVAVFSLLSASIWVNVRMSNDSFQYNRVSNDNVNRASNLLNRLAHGTQGYWGMRAASRSSSSVIPTGVTGLQGQQGWQATLDHNISDTTDLPSVMQDAVKVWTYNPLTGQIDVDGTVVGNQVEDSYLRILNGDIVIGVRIESENGGSDAMMESLIRMRNL